MPRKATAKAPELPFPLLAETPIDKADKKPTGAGVITYHQTFPPLEGSDLQDADIARETLRAVCRDVAAPAAARAQAARTLAEMAQALGRHQPPPADPTRPIASMTLAEIEAELTAAQG